MLLGGLRVIGANYAGQEHGVFTDTPGSLSNDFFKTILDMNVTWHAIEGDEVFEARDRKTGKAVRTGTRTDLIFGSNSQLRALSEAYGSDDANTRFVADFVKTWNKVMNADRFDLA